LRKLGKESSLDEAAKATEDCFHAMERTAELVADLDEIGLERGAALGGALTHLLTHLIAVSPDTQTAMGMLSSCISNATFNADSADISSHPGTSSIQ